MAIIGSLKAILSAQAAQYKKGMTTAAVATKRAQREITRSGKKIERVGRSFQAVGATMTAGITVPLVALGTVAARAAIKFESAFTGVRKTVKATDVQFAALSSGIREMSLEIPVASTALAGIAEAGGQLGIATEHILGFTRVVADMSATTNLTADEAATAFARIANVTGLPQEKFENLGSTIVALGNTSATTESEITNMALRLGAAGRQAGLSTEETLGMAAALSSVGIQAEAGGSAMSRIMKDITVSVAKGGKGLEGYAKVAGQTTTEFARAFETDAAGAIETFLVGLGKLSGPEALGALEQLGIEGIRTSDAALRLAQAGDLLGRSLDTAKDSFAANNALAAEAALRYGTTESQVELAKNALNEMARVMGVALLPVVRAATQAIRDMLPAVQGAAEWFQGLPGWVKGTALAFVGIVAAVGPALLIVGQLAIALGGIATAFGASGAATLLLAAGLGKLTAGLAVAKFAAAGLMTAMAAHPVVAVALAVGALTLALTKYSTSQTLANAKIAENNDMIDKQTGRVNNAAVAWERQQRNIIDAGLALDVLGEKIDPLGDKMGSLTGQWGDLSGLVGEIIGTTADAAAATAEQTAIATEASKLLAEQKALEAEAARVQMEEAWTEVEAFKARELAKQTAATAAAAAISETHKRLQGEIALVNAEGLQKRLLEIQIGREQEIAGLVGLADESSVEYARMVADVNVKYGLMVAKAREAHTGIEAAAAKQGFSTRAEFDRSAQAASDLYDSMVESGLFSIGTLDAAFAAAEEARRADMKTTETFALSSSQALVSGMSGIFGELGKKHKKAAIAGAIISTAQAVVKALAAYPWPASLVPAAAAALAGGIQIAKIRSSDTGWAQGTPGTSFKDFGAGSFEILHGREAVITESQGASLAGMIGAAIERSQRGVQAPELGSPRDQGGGGGVNVSVGPLYLTVEGGSNDPEELGLAVARKLTIVLNDELDPNFASALRRTTA